ncbi:DUF1178 family protein [Maritimibacter dapengensis]|uniref:DUF1178 family protein n=1 Tax=Maritimibacter dapengensis TaxID=2836868 RepID=A0ABS6T196_9RHOB|nr:DUF1178 family protein [Maritimibacter dapengensis]MBV7378765.1 DUF1178 family protein [Maritimibacter dapengensis]
MIRYALKCAEGHDFESWFQSASAFDALAGTGRVECPHCGSTSVDKSLMAPQVAKGRGETPRPLAPQDDTERKIAALKAKVEAESDYVGVNFVKEARAMHEGSAPERSIYGEAKPKDAIALLEDGIPVAPLPFTPRAKAN